MTVETLDNRVLFSAVGHSATHPVPVDAIAHRATLHHDSAPKFLPISILGAYGGNLSFPPSTYFEPASMVITRQARRSFEGTLTLDSITRPFKATLSTFRAKGRFGPGYYATAHYTNPYFNVRLIAAIVPGQDPLIPGDTYIGFEVVGGESYFKPATGLVSLYPNP